MNQLQRATKERREKAMNALFNHELSLVRSVESSLESATASTETTSPSDLKRLSASYRELLVMVMKLTSISDALQFKLRRTESELSSSLEQVHRLNRSLKALNQEKNEILALAAHDLRSPLSGVRGLAELMATGEIEPEESAVFAGEIVTSTDEMLSMVSQLLEIYRTDSPLRTPDENWKTVTLEDLLALVEDIPRPYAARKRIVLHGECFGAEERLSIEGGLFARVAENLLSNAVKFSDPGAEVFLRLSREGDFVALEVEDRGPGLSEQDQQRLFLKGEELSSRPTAGEVSAGLGLSIVHRILSHLGGRIWCESVLGQGATFHVRFPARFH